MWLLVMVPKIKLDNDYSILHVNDILLPLWQCQKNEGQLQASAEYIYIYITFIFIVRPIPKGYHKNRIKEK